jgi:DNA-binding Lrp family transcriptional regulator
LFPNRETEVNLVTLLSQEDSITGGMITLRSFLLIKTQPGMEKEILGRFETLPEVRELHLVTGKFDLLVALESEDVDLDPRSRVVEVVVEKIRKLGGIVDTRTIFPIEQQVRPIAVNRPTVKGFVFIQSESGKEKDLMSKLLTIPEVVGVHLLFGKADVLAEVEVEKSFVHPPPQRIASLVKARISKFQGVRDTDTYVPLDSIIKPK